jgi:hypothetical protein
VASTADPTMPDTATADTPNRFPDRLRLRVPRGLAAAVEIAAGRHHQTPAEFARQALLRALEQNGLRLLDGRVETTERPE